MLRLRAWVFFLFLLLIGALLVATAPSFQTCLGQAGPQAASSQPQRHGTTVTAARTTRDCLARFFTENRDDIIAGLALILALSTAFLWFATRDLVADPPAELLQRCIAETDGRVSPEFLRSQLEVKTSVCASVSSMRRELAALRRKVCEVSADYGIAPIAASTHPTAITSPVWSRNRAALPNWRRAAHAASSALMPACSWSRAFISTWNRISSASSRSKRSRLR